MEEKKNYQKGIIIGLTGGILGTFICAAICVMIGINLFVIQRDSLEQKQTETTVDRDDDVGEPSIDLRFDK